MSEVNCRVYTLWLSDDMMKDIKHVAVEDGVSVAFIIRQLVDDYLTIRLS